jgi:hypothetical protein
MIPNNAAKVCLFDQLYKFVIFFLQLQTHMHIGYIIRIGYFCDTMGERMGRIGRIDTDFF